MAKTILYIAATLDGYIARKDGSIDWLSSVDQSDDDYGYGDFYRNIDALVIGNNTYQQILGFGDWPYKGKKSYIVTNHCITPEGEDVECVNGGLEMLKKKIAEAGHERVWLVGGGQLVASFLNAGMIDEYIVSIVPVILGEGISLFQSPLQEQSLTFLEAQSHKSGLVQLHYQKSADKS